MPRIRRNVLVHPNSTNHCTWRGHNREKVLWDPKDARFYRSLLRQYKKRYGILIHAYCFMGTHPHVVVTSKFGQVAFSKFWQIVNYRFARYYNRTRERTGQVVQERLRSPLIQPDNPRQMLTVMLYGDLNPVRAGIAESAGDWEFSSHRHYAYGEKDPLIDDAPEYLALAQSRGKRCLAYRNLFANARRRRLLKRRVDLTKGPFIGRKNWPRLKRYREAFSTGTDPPAEAHARRRTR